MKGLKFQWLDDVHKKELEAILVSIWNLLPLLPFNPDLESHIFIDALTFQFGYCFLLPCKDRQFSVIHCGSTGIKPHRVKYKPYDL